MKIFLQIILCMLFFVAYVYLVYVTEMIWGNVNIAIILKILAIPIIGAFVFLTEWYFNKTIR